MHLDEVKDWRKHKVTQALVAEMEKDVEDLKEMLTQEEGDLPNELCHAKVRGMIVGYRACLGLCDTEMVSEFNN